MTVLSAKLHEGQMEVFKDRHRFKIIAAGRRWGKSRLAAWLLLIKALECRDKTKHVFYVAPTFQQAKDIMWEVLFDIGRDVIKNSRQAEGMITLVNDVKISLKGSDRPETMRGVGLYFCVIDEYADMKPFVWEEIIRPALADVMGECVFIGTPKGRNHFYELYTQAYHEPDWGRWHFTSKDNPFLPKGEVDAAQRGMSSTIFRQEFEASFESGGSDLFKADWIKYQEEEPEDGSFFVAVDLCGFKDISHRGRAQKQSRLDDTAIAIVKTGTYGWWVKEIQHGRWDVRETAVRILKAARDNDAVAVGIEKGALMYAVQPYIMDNSRRIGYYPNIQALSHGNQRKEDRILWALQGRFEHGRISIKEGPWLNKFIEQYKHFGSRYTKDDMMDALSYIDQISVVAYGNTNLSQVYAEPEAIRSFY